MIDIYNVVASGGEWEDAYTTVVASFTKEEDAQKYIEDNCILQGQEMQEKHGLDGNNYLWWRNKNIPRYGQTESWELQYSTVYENLEEINNED